MSKAENVNTVQIRVSKSLLDDVRVYFPETQGLSYTGFVDVALRTLLKLLEAEEEVQV